MSVVDDGREPSHWGLLIAAVAAVFWSPLVVLIASGIVRVLWPTMIYYKWGGLFAIVAPATLLVAGVAWLLLYLAEVRPRRSDDAGMYAISLFTIVGLVQTAIAALALVFLQQLFVGFPMRPTVESVQASARAQQNRSAEDQLDARYAMLTSGTQARYRATLLGLDLDRAMATQRLAAPGGIAVARSRIRSARAAVQEYAAANQINRETYRGWIRDAKMEPWLRTQKLSAFETMTKSDNDMLLKFLGLEDSIYAEMDALLAGLSKSRDAWTVKGDMFLFSQRAALTMFERHNRSIRVLSQREKKLLDSKRRDPVPVPAGNNSGFVPPQRL